LESPPVNLVQQLDAPCMRLMPTRDVRRWHEIPMSTHAHILDDKFTQIIWTHLITSPNSLTSLPNIHKSCKPIWSSHLIAWQTGLKRGRRQPFVCPILVSLWSMRFKSIWNPYSLFHPVMGNKVQHFKCNKIFMNVTWISLLILWNLTYTNEMNFHLWNFDQCCFHPCAQRQTFCNEEFNVLSSIRWNCDGFGVAGHEWCQWGVCGRTG
jgi:hypothetical protein